MLEAEQQQKETLGIQSIHNPTGVPTSNWLQERNAEDSIDYSLKTPSQCVARAKKTHKIPGTSSVWLF